MPRAFFFFTQEKDAIMDSLKRKAKSTSETLKCLEGVRCNEIAGAMYAFPRLLLPCKAIEEAKVSESGIEINERTYVRSMYVCIYVYMYVLYVYMYVCMYVFMYLCMYVCMYVRMHACMYVDMYVGRYVGR